MKKSQTSLLSFFGSAKPKNKTASAPPVETPEPPKKTQKKTVRFALDLEEEEEDKEVKENVEPVAGDMDLDDVVESSQKGRLVKRVSYQEDSSDEEDVSLKLQKGKRRKLVQRIDDDSEDEFLPSGDKDEDMKEEEFIPEMDELEEEEPEEEEPAVKKLAVKEKESSNPISPVVNRFKNISVSQPPKSPFSRLTSKQEQRKEKAEKFQKDNEERYRWLQDVKDADKNPFGSENYDPRTLFIPDSAWRAFKPFEKQYWEIKCKHWDTIVFFKKGKFYELYEKDAIIGHQDFDLKLTARVNMSMVGVPEMAFDFWAAQFIAKGYRVAKVDQMETAIGKSLREKDGAASSKADKLIRRELTSVLTQGTLVDSGLLTNDLGTYCMSIKESFNGKTPSYGVCFVDTATAEFNLAVFEDDLNKTKLETLLMQIKPREIVTEKGRLDVSTNRLLKNTLSEPLWNMLIPDTEFWSAITTQDELRIKGYFGDEESDFPDALKKVKDNDLIMSAFGAMVWYLRSLKLDYELLSTKNIALYDPVRNSNSLVLDGQTLANLEIFENTMNGGSEGTVLKLLSNSITPFGKRLFRKWLCHPLYNIEDIEARLDAVEDFMRLMDLTQNLSDKLSKIPDLERLISRIHSGRCKVSEFLTALDGFKDIVCVIDALKKDSGEFKSKLLNNLIERFPNIDDKLDYFSNGFTIAAVDVDYQKVKTIIPNPGVNEKWDMINNQIKDVETEFDQYLKEVKKKLRVKVEYKNIGKEINQMEVPKGTKVPSDWIQLSATTKVTRYWNSTVKDLVTTYKELLERKNECVKEFSKGVYQEFDQHYVVWLSAVQTIANLDVLMSLAKGSYNMGEPACRPEFVNSEKGLIEFKDLRHPCVATGISSDFIPNDVGLGGDDPSLIVLTGPNMGGKSTLLRQTCVAVIMAQLGCYVPASLCRMTPCDRIFTRIGANDNIMGGESTFMVELSETSKILREASNRSMVILDELGRGTSTFDGYAIAYAVLHYLATHIGCVGMFSTHYQTLCKEFERNPEINNMHMGYILENEQVIFLYKLTKGICEKSFGMNVATMAGVPKSIVDEASRVADDFEKTHKLKDSTWTSSKSKITPSVLADLNYLFSDKTKPDAVKRIVKSFKQL